MSTLEARPASAAHFYAGDCVRATRRFLQGFTAPAAPEKVVAGIVPHAGWQYSGAVAAKVFESIRQKERPATFVIFGAVHRWPGTNAVYARGAWATPLGNMPIDEALARQILAAAPEWTVEEPRAHRGEHSIEVQLPFLKFLFPEAAVVPIAVNPDSIAAPLGQRVGELLKKYNRLAVVIGSTDLTHYGDPYGFAPAGYGSRAHQWLRENDDRIIRLAEQMAAAEIVPEAAHHRNACGGGAMAATVAAAQVLGAARGYLLEHTTSYDVEPEGEFRMAVGYAGMLF
ncbi:MAG: AmmeMemoRadiSam system protein B [Acidobacteria bacterium]|nr:AmmeMemoRadiSam system protein B [Acidobacteriota bacterium]